MSASPHVRTRRLPYGPAVAFLLVLAGCGDLVVDGRSLRIDATGAVEGLVFGDIDGNSTFDGSDPRLQGVRVQLLTPAGAAVVDTATTDVEGRFRMNAVPVGEYRLGVAPVSLGDSLVPVNLSQAPILVEPGRTFPTNFGLGYPVYSLEEVRALPPGTPLFTIGVALNRRDTPGDGVVHVRNENVALRLTDVPPTEILVGDSVRIRGRTALSAGQPILEDAAVFRLRLSDELIFPVVLSSAQAATASAGTLDAALVRIENAVILAASVNADQHLVVTADDGSGPVDVVLRNFLGLSAAGIEPGTSRFTFATGLLVPIQDGIGGVRWRLFPRAQGDLDVDPLPGG